MTADSFMSLAPEVLTVLAAALLIVAAGCDIATRTIPNFIPLGLAVLGFAHRAVDGSLLWALVAAGIVFGAAILCWMRGWMGGGDVKLLGACALLVPPLSVFSMVGSVAMAGGVLAAIYLVARRVVTFSPTNVPARQPLHIIGRVLRAERWRLARGAALPYAVAIAAGSLISIP